MYSFCDICCRRITGVHDEATGKNAVEFEVTVDPKFNKIRHCMHLRVVLDDDGSDYGEVLEAPTPQRLPLEPVRIPVPSMRSGSEINITVLHDGAPHLFVEMREARSARGGQ